MPVPHKNPDGIKNSVPQFGATAPTLVGIMLLAQGDVFSLDQRHADASEAYRRAHDLYCEKKAWPLARRAQNLLGTAMSLGAPLRST